MLVDGSIKFFLLFIMFEVDVLRVFFCSGNERSVKIKRVRRNVFMSFMRYFFICLE